MSSRRLPRVRSVLRGLVTLLAVFGVVVGVSACQVRPGAAAFVGNEKISEADVATYAAVSPSSSAGTDGTSLSPRSQIVSTLVAIQLFRQYLRGKGGVPSDTALLTSRDTAFRTVTGQAFPEIGQFRTTLEGLGFDGSFADVYATQIELEYEVIQRSKASSLAELAKAVGAVTDTPKISPRYGSWDAAQLSLSGSSTTPDYLKLSASSSGT